MTLPTRKIPIESYDMGKFHNGYTKHGDCWEWRVARGAGGYGGICIKGKNYIAHRVAWLLFRGEIPNGLLVLHKCDNRRCVNPDHLFLGTHLDNARDKIAKGRDRYNPPRGTKVNSAKLTEAEVLEIRQIHAAGEMGCRRLAKRFGVNKSTMCSILNGKTWKHLLEVA